MLLQGSLRQFNLPNILQLVKMSASTGALSLRRGDAHGKIFFSSGSICYAFAQPQSLPIGQRFVNARHITPAQLREASALQRESPGSGRLGAILVNMGLTDQATLDAMVTEQIQDTVFDFFGWPDGDFEFNDNEVAVDEDIFVEMQVESVIMESCRRVDEMEFILEQLGSLESIPRLSRGHAADQMGEVVFAAEDWSVASRVDGHADINTVLLDCDCGRFYGAKIMHRLFERGLITIAPPATWSLEEGLSIGVFGCDDAHREIFIATLTGGNVLRQLRTEIADEGDTDVPVLVGRVSAGEGGADGDVFVFSVAATAPDAALKSLVQRSDAWILIVDARDAGSVRAASGDLARIKEFGNAPLVIAAHAPVAGEALAPAEVATLLGVAPETPILRCRLRDGDCVRDAFAAVMRRLEGSHTGAEAAATT
jgi:hypothetical protein